MIVASTWLDLGLIVVVVIYAISGWMRGFVANVSEIIGLVGGAAIGIMSAPAIFETAWPSGPLWAIAYVLVIAVLGQLCMRVLTRGFVPRSRTGSLLNSGGGLVVSTVGVLFAAWALGYAVTRANVPGVADVARDSRVLAAVDRIMPKGAAEALHAFSNHLADDVLPVYLEPFAPEIIPDVGPPDERALRTPAVRAASDSVVRVQGYSQCTEQGATGSGFAIAADRIMTNAHVVSGVDEPLVDVGGVPRAARTVYFDPRVDVAVLEVPGLDLDPLTFVGEGRTGTAGDDAVVLGYPGGGPLSAAPARVRGVLSLKGSDIYDRRGVVREAISIRSSVRAGNSGGPLVSLDGEVLGVVFASSLADNQTGYALTADQVRKARQRGISAETPVSTGGC